MIEATNGIFGHGKMVVTFDGTTISVRQGHRETRTPVSKVATIGWCEPTMRKMGYIEFLTAGAKPASLASRLDLGSKISSAVVFTGKHLAEFKALRDAVEAAMAP